MASRVSSSRPPRTRGDRAGPETLEKCPTGIHGFDEITFGGLPRGRPTLVCGGPGCGKTVFATEFLARGATQFGEPGVLVSFEETAEDLRKNVSSLGFDLQRLIDQKKLVVDHVRVERSEIAETGEYDLDGLFIRLGYAIDFIGARRVVLDTLESLFTGFSNEGILRAELRRLFGWLKEKGVTAVITGERGEKSLTRQGLEEYVSDCVVVLDHRVENERTTRRLRIVKYRGSLHGTNEYPFIIDQSGFSVIPITSLGLRHEASTERIPSGVPQLDAMLGGTGYFRGSSVLVTGTAGSGKTSIAAHFAYAVAHGGERCLYFAFEESESQIIRNMRSIGLDLGPAVQQGLLAFRTVRPTMYGLETHLAKMHRAIDTFSPAAVVFDPITNLVQAGRPEDVGPTLVRLIDLLKGRGITALFTSLTSGGAAAEGTAVGVSSLMDTWLLLRNLESGGERNRGLYIMKSRGMAHSNQIREFVLTEHGIDLVEVYTGKDGVLTGSARLVQAANERAAQAAREAELAEHERRYQRKHAMIQAQIAALQLELESEAFEVSRARQVEDTRKDFEKALSASLGRRRWAGGARVEADREAKKPSRNRAPTHPRKRNGRSEMRS
jgi:circadian clock protein KaiC